VRALQKDFVLLSGAPSTYIKTADSGAQRAQVFCPHCGPPLYTYAVGSYETYGMNKSTLRIASIAAAALLSSALVAEVSLRAFAPQPQSTLNIYVRHPSLPVYALRPNAETALSNGESHWTVLTDRSGFRVRSGLGRSKEGSKAILILGGTNTFGYDVNHEQTFAGLLEESAPDVHVINAAVPIYGPVQYRMVLEDLLSTGLRPDVILVGFCPGTDFAHVLSSKDVMPKDGYLQNNQGAASELKKNSHLYRFVASLAHRAFTGGDPSVVPEERPLLVEEEWRHPPLSLAASRVADEARRIRDLATLHSARLVFVMVPTAVMVSSERANKAAGLAEPLDLPSLHTEAILRNLGIEFVDATPAIATLPAGTTHYRFDRHLTPQAHRMVYEEIRRALGRRTDGAL